MKLTVKDRLMILGMLPQEGTLAEMVDIYDLARELKLSDEEKDNVKYVENGQSIKWDAEKDPMKDINFSKDQKAIFMKVVDRLDAEKKINLGQIETILKIKNG